MQSDCTKLCECGCGNPAPLASHTVKSRGWVRGKPIRFIQGHNPPTNTFTIRVKSEERGYTSPCLIWQGVLDEYGYGLVQVDGRKRLAHRVNYELSGKTIPEGFDLHHKCEVRECVNPEHLQPLDKAAHQHLRSRLSNEDFVAIRASSKRNRDVAIEFGISESYACMIRKGYRKRKPPLGA